MITESINISIKNIKKRRLRTFLTLVGITISIATIFVLVSLSLGLEATIQEQFEEFGGDRFFIQPRGQFGPPGSGATGAELTTDDFEVVKRVSGVRDASYWIIGNAKIEFRDEIRFIPVIGAYLENDLVYQGYDLDEGRFLEKGDTKKILIGSQYKNNNFLGQEIKLRDTITIQGVDFKVVGILETVGNPADDRLIYLPENEFRDLFEIEERVDFIIAQVNDINDIDRVAESTERKLMKSRDVNEKTIDFSILTPEEALAVFGTVLNIVTSFLFSIAAISLLVGGINIANTMFTSVLERTREIGVMKAIGAKNKDILSIFLVEAGILGLVGGTLGILLGLGIAKGVEYIAITQLATTLLQISTPLWLFVFSLAFAFIAGAVSGLYPAWKATKVKPVEALRYE
jgi:putative ABC transport system permease protein